jgi:putative two-component system response regulator
MARLVIVDDSEEMRITMRAVLESDGHEVVEANSGFSAIEIITRLRPDAVVLDITLGDIEGMAVLRRVRANADLRDTPIVVVSGHDTRATREEAEEAGANAFITKPFRNEDLTATVSRLIAQD